jgi:hypothetical protein
MSCSGRAQAGALAGVVTRAIKAPAALSLLASESIAASIDAVITAASANENKRAVVRFVFMVLPFVVQLCR